MITSSALNSNSLTGTPYTVYASTSTGLVGGTGQKRAITTMILCNTGTPDENDETVNSATVNIYMVPSGSGVSAKNLVVSNLVIPAGETVFFSEERIILDENDTIRMTSTSGGTESAGSFVVGANYTILTAGDTDFTLIGAANNSPGTHFTAIGVGVGTGTAVRNLVSVTISTLQV